MRRRIGLVVHHGRPQARAIGVDVAGWLESEGHDVRLAESDRSAVPELSGAAVGDEDLALGTDAVVSIGGDGTMLRAVRIVGVHGTPILGINVGHLGYLTGVSPRAWKDALQRVIAGNYSIEERMTMDVSADGCGTLTALNDAVAEKPEAGHTVRVGVTISGQRTISYAADALIVATPTGSTAYSLSAGGPVVSPALRALVVTPVAAHSLFGKALVVAGDEVVRVEVLSDAAVLAVDGRHCGRLSEGDVVECRAGATPARLITFGERDFWAVITAKFGLSAGG